MSLESQLRSERFARTAKYHPDWILASVSGGANALWLTEWLAPALNLQPGMRVLDLGCGSAASSIFLHREYGVQVWATDLWTNVDDNHQRVRDANATNGVFPHHANARDLPYPSEFFDAIISIDSFPYYGTDDLYLSYLLRLLKPKGALAIAGAGLVQEIEGPVPEHLRAWWEPDTWCLHSAAWWRRHWERTGLVDMELADTMPDGWKVWLEWHQAVCPDNRTEISALEADQGRYLGYIRAVARRRPDAKLSDPIHALPPGYTKAPLLRD